MLFIKANKETDEETNKNARGTRRLHRLMILKSLPSKFSFCDSNKKKLQ